MIREISSFQNDWVKHVKMLQEKNRARRKEGVFLVEGLNELKLCLAGGYTIREFAFCKDWISLEKIENWIGHSQSNLGQIYSLSSSVLESLVMRGNVENALAIVELPTIKPSLKDIKSDGLYLLAESVEKPGNLGAILRSADAAAIDAVIICDELVDVFHPTVIRNSLGCIFTVPVIQCTAEQAIEVFGQKKLNVFTTFMNDSVSVFDADLTQGAVIVVGTEHQGVTDQWKHVGQNINIPMLGSVDSLNVSVAASVLMYEARRQRIQKSI